MIDSKLCLDFSTVVLAHILNHHALVSQDKAELLVSYSLLLYAGKDEPRWMDFILLESIQMRKNRLFCKIMTEVRLGFYDCYKILSASFALCFEMCKLAKLEKEDLGMYCVYIYVYFLKKKLHVAHKHISFIGYITCKSLFGSGGRNTW